MKKINSLKQVSNPYSTGGGGSNFERKVQAVFLLSLLVDGFIPVINKKIQRIDFQGNHLGYKTDDLIVTSSSPKEIKLLCQIKSDITISGNNAIFQEVVSAAWSDYNNQNFTKGRDKLLLITGIIAKQSYNALTTISSQANCTPDSTVFIQNIDTANFISDNTRKYFTVIKNCLIKANNDSSPSDDEIYGFCKTFTLLIFDMDYENSVNKMLIHSLIGCKTDRDARDVWCRLEDLSAGYNQSGGSVTIDVIPDEIKDLFQQQPTTAANSIRVLSFTSSETLSIIALLGSWDGNNNYDQATIAEITGNTYQVFETKARELLISHGQFLKYNGGIWSVSNRRQLFSLNSDFFFDKVVICALNSCASLLRQKSKRFTENNEYGYVIPQGGAYDNSDALRNGFVKGLCLLTNNIDLFHHLTQDTVKTQVINMIRKFFDNCDWTRLVSTGDLLPFIAEMAPIQYIKLLEKFVVANPDDIIRLFPNKNNNPLLDTGFIHYVIWSIEAVTWIPECLVQGIACLGEMAKIPFVSNGGFNEAAINSITAILLPWHPQTLATAEKQKNAVKGLLTSTPEVGWNVIMRLMPHGTSTTMGTYKPRYMNCDIPKEIQVSKETYNDLCLYYTDLAVELAGSNVSRLETLSELSCYMSPRSFLTYVKSIIATCADKADNDKYLLWIKLCDVKYRIILDNEKANPENECFKQLCEAINAIEPHNIFYKYQSLYLSKFNKHLLDDDLDWKKEDAEKAEAVFDLFQKQGIDSVFDFGICVNNKYDVGGKLGKRVSSIDLDKIINRLHAKNLDRDFTMSIICGYVYSHGVSDMSYMNLQRFEPEFVANVLSAINLSGDLIKLMQSFLKEHENLYWKIARMPYAFYDDAGYDLSYVVKKLIEVERPAVALNYCGQNIKNIAIDNDLIYEVLKKAATVQDVVKPDQHAACNLIEKLQNDNNVDIDRLSEIEFIYLPYLDQFSSVKPRAMYYRISNQPLYFCEILKLCYKRRHNEMPGKKNEKIAHHLFDLVFNFCVVPGTDWNGSFHCEVFKSWIREVDSWSKDNDRYEIAMQTIGHGLTYAPIENGLPDCAIMEVLNSAEADEMRRGYKIEVFNKIGAHFIDPEGKPEREQARIYNKNADKAENLGYSRFAQLYRDIACNFINEAEENKKEEQEYRKEIESD